MCTEKHLTRVSLWVTKECEILENNKIFKKFMDLTL